jgi:hypothetical protein
MDVTPVLPRYYPPGLPGYDLLREESGIPPELLGGHKEVKVEAAWSPVMYHRLRTVDLLITLEVAIRKRTHLALIQTFLEYRRVKRGNQVVHETMDYVDSPESAENKIIPDGAFILENVQTKKRALFFLEMDMATERIITASPFSQQTSLHRKFSQYDRYLKSFRYAKTYQEFGEFRLWVFGSIGTENRFKECSPYHSGRVRANKTVNCGHMHPEHLSDLFGRLAFTQ